MDAQVLTLPALVETYLARCTVEGKSPRTIRAYRETLARFCRCLEEDAAPLDPHQLRPDHVIAYLARYADHAPDTRHRYFREVRCFCNWLRTAGYTENDPFRGLRNVRLPQKIVPPFSPTEIGALLRACNGGTPLGSRDRALILTLLDTGVRCAETVALDLADCDFTTRRLLVRHGKGDKARVVPFATHCADALNTYLLDRGTDAGPLFLGARHGRLHPGVRLGINGPQDPPAHARPRRRHPQGARPPLPPHVRDVGHRPRRPRARRPTSARPPVARTWCGATRATYRQPPRPPSATHGVLARRSDARGLRAERTRTRAARPPSACVLPEAKLTFPIWRG